MLRRAEECVHSAHASFVKHVNRPRMVWLFCIHREVAPSMYRHQAQRFGTAVLVLTDEDIAREGEQTARN